MASTYYAEGLHIGQVTKQGLTKASTGTPQFVLTLKVLGVPSDDGSYVPHNQQYERSIYMALTEKTAPFVKSKLQALGFTGYTMGQLDASHPQHQSFLGSQVDLWCSYDTDQKGQMREKWQISAGQRVGEPLQNRDVRQLDSLFGDVLKPMGTTVPAPQKADQPSTRPANGQYFPANQEITDEDIPF